MYGETTFFQYLRREPPLREMQGREPSPTTQGGSDISLDGDPQAGYPAFLVLTRECPFRLFTSPISHRRGE